MIIEDFNRKKGWGLKEKAPRTQRGVLCKRGLDVSLNGVTNLNKKAFELKALKKIRLLDVDSNHEPSG